MSKVQVLVATMNQTDFSLAEKMNIKCDAIIGNQTDKNQFDLCTNENYNWIMHSTSTKGVGTNRNICLTYATDEILLMADDDVIYDDDYVEKIETAFEECVDADVIIFAMRFSKNGMVYDEDKHPKGRLKFHKALKYGTYQIAIKRSALLRSNLHFTCLFGGGSIYGSGEDSKFIMDCFKSKLHIYTHPAIIGTNNKDTSTWFNGFNEKYFYDRGAFFRFAMPYFGVLYSIRFIFGLKNCSLTIMQRIRALTAGYKGYVLLESYEHWKTGV